MAETQTRSNTADGQAGSNSVDGQAGSSTTYGQTGPDGSNGQVDPRRDPRLLSRISTAIADAVADYFEKVLVKPMPPAFLETIEYERALGAYILDQNPYAEVEKLERPRIPEDPAAETRWIRKSGVLRTKHALSPLSKYETIPAGEVLDFMFEKWDHLAENSGWTEQDPDPKPSIPPAIPSDLTEIYRHRVVKFVRFRYTVKDRKKTDDRQAAYFLVAYTGTDH